MYKLGCIKTIFSCLAVGSNVEYVQTALTYFDYGKDVKSQNVFNISCLASVVDTDYEYFGQDDFRVRKPDIEFEVSVCHIVVLLSIIYLIYFLG